MRVKIGDKWFEPTIGQPVMIELTQQDKANIDNMHPDATRYAIFDDDDDRSSERRRATLVR